MIGPAQPNVVGSFCNVPIDVADQLIPEDLPELTAMLKRPGSNREKSVQCKILSDGNLSVSFVPKSPGEHLITVKKSNQPIPGSPFSVMITAVPLRENIRTEDLLRLSVGLLRPGSIVEERVIIETTQSGDNLCASFTLHKEGEHKIIVKKDKEPVEEAYPVNRPCVVGLDILSVVLPDDFKKLTATLQRPDSREEEPVNLKLNPGNTLGE